MTRRELLEKIAADSPAGTALLAFSCGKDSIAAWLEMQASGLFREIIPIHLALVPGLAFVEQSLRYFEEVFETRILRLIHPSFYRMLGHCVFQPPERLDAIRALGLDRVRFDYAAVRQWASEDLGLAEPGAWLAVGVRAADSPQRAHRKRSLAWLG